jgi:hypothetical protein
MTIIDLEGKVREIKSIKKIVHKIKNVISGELIDVEFAEVVIVGKEREWIQWYPLIEFKKLNPKVRV